MRAGPGAIVSEAGFFLSDGCLTGPAGTEGEVAVSLIMRRSVHWQAAVNPWAVSRSATVPNKRCRAMPYPVVRRLLPLLFLFLHCLFTSPAFALNFNANWDYLESGGEGRETYRQFQQRYNLGVGQSLSYQPTRAITASAGIGYSRSQRDSGNGMVNVDQLTPISQLTVANDIFVTSLSGTLSKTRYNSTAGVDSESSSKSWDASLASAWVVPFFPSLTFNIGEMTDTNERNISAVDQSVSTTTYNKGMNMDWDLVLARMFYTYSDQTAVDPYENQTDSQSHFARFETGGKFLDRRLSFNFAQQFQRSTQDFILKGKDEGGAYRFPIKGQTLAAVTDPLSAADPFAAPEPIAVPLFDYLSLRDSNFDDPVLSVEPDLRVALAFKFDFAEQIDIVRLTASTLLTSAQAAAMQWRLYLKDPTDTGWVLAPDSVPTTYDPILKSFTMTLGRSEREIMLVAVNNTGDKLEFTEAETFSLRAENFGSTNLARLSSLGVRVKLTKSLNASANVTLDHFESDSGDNVTTNDRRSTSAHLGWTPVPSFSPSVSFSETRESTNEQEESLNRSYSFNLATIPLPSMNVTFGASQSENFNGTRKISASTRYNLTTMARIYPDLNAALYLATRETEELKSSERIFITTTSFSARLNLNAQLRRDLAANLTSNYLTRQQDYESRSENADAIYSLQYRPSAIFSLRGAYATTLLGQGPSDKWTVGLNLALLRTHKARLNLTATHSQAERVSDSLAVDGTWDISKNLLLASRTNLVYADLLSYALQISLKLKF